MLTARPLKQGILCRRLKKRVGYEVFIGVEFEFELNAVVIARPIARCLPRTRVACAPG